MKKLVVVLLIVFIAIIIIYKFAEKKYNLIPQSIISTVKAPSEDIRTSFPQGSTLNFPLQVPQGFKMALFADLKTYGSPRVLTFDPNGVLFATLTSQGKVVVAPDKNSDGVADEIIEVANKLNKPHGMQFYKDKFYLAESDKVRVFDYDPSTYKISNPKLLFSLPGGGRHFTRTIKILGDKIYTSVGSSCDTCVESDWRRASILVSNLDGSDLKTYAKGLRNTVFFVFANDGKMWGNDMGRDFLGDNLPPDDLNVILDSKDYGWPFCYGNKVRDLKFEANSLQNYCDSTDGPAFAYPAHVAPLGLAFINSSLFAKDDQGNILSAFHGSWNSSVPVGYKIVKLTLKDNKVTQMEDFITGWIKGREVLGRPVDLIFNAEGLLFISDDKANLVYILTK